VPIVFQRRSRPRRRGWLPATSMRAWFRSGPMQRGKIGCDSVTDDVAEQRERPFILDWSDLTRSRFQRARAQTARSDCGRGVGSAATRHRVIRQHCAKQPRGWRRDQRHTAPICGCEVIPGRYFSTIEIEIYSTITPGSPRGIYRGGPAPASRPRTLRRSGSSPDVISIGLSPGRQMAHRPERLIRSVPYVISCS
jgi:hypothetical protein